MTFVKERKQFRRPIAEFEGLQGMLADMAVALNAARLSLHQAALSADPFPNSLLVAPAKIIVSETANTVTNQALQLFGARATRGIIPSNAWFEMPACSPLQAARRRC